MAEKLQSSRNRTKPRRLSSILEASSSSHNPSPMLSDISICSSSNMSHSDSNSEINEPKC